MPIAQHDIARLHTDIRAEVERAERSLRRRGCAAAGYRLSGPDAPQIARLCCIHLSRDYRMIVGFPGRREVAVLLVGRHLRSPALNIFDRLYRSLGINSPRGERKKPPCCHGDGSPPVDAELIEKTAKKLKRLGGD